MRSRSVGRTGITESDRGSFEEAIRLAREALAIDSQCGAAWRSIALANWGLTFSSPFSAFDQILNEGLHAARCAVAIDSQDHAAHQWMGLLLSHAGQPAAGLAEMRRAHDLNPNDPQTLAMLGQYEAGSGNPRQGIRRTIAAQRLSPRDSIGWFYFFSGAMAHFFAGEYERAVECARRAVADAPNFFNANMALVVSWVGLGEVDSARSLYPVLAALAAPAAEARLAGRWPYAHPPFVRRATVFLRVAAGLEDSSAADTLR
jgi:tetratricopeptide (TPR) repeat protein